jgi:hypothetical protein
MNQFESINTKMIVTVSYLSIVPLGVTIYMIVLIGQVILKYFAATSAERSKTAEMMTPATLQPVNDNEDYGDERERLDRVAYDDLSAENINARIAESLRVYADYNTNVQRYWENVRAGKGAVDVVDRNVMDPSADEW